MHLDVILDLLLLTIIFFSFQNQLYFLRAPLKIHKSFSYNIFRMFVGDIEYPQEICSPILVVEEFSELFAHQSAFSIKDSISA